MKLARLLTLPWTAGAASLLAPAAATAQGKTELLWLGQASILVKSPGGKNIVIDPWLTFHQT